MLSHFTRVRLFAAPQTYPARLLCSWDFPGKNLKWVAISSPEDLFDPGFEPASLMSSALADGFFTTGTTWGALMASGS